MNDATIDPEAFEAGFLMAGAIDQRQQPGRQQAGHLAEQGAQVAMLPTRALAVGGLVRRWELARHAPGLAEVRGVAGEGEVQAELHVLDDVPARQVDAADRPPRE